MKDLFVLTNNEFEKDHYINLISDRLTHIKTGIQNGSIVRRLIIILHIKVYHFLAIRTFYYQRNIRFKSQENHISDCYW